MYYLIFFAIVAIPTTIGILVGRHIFKSWDSSAKKELPLVEETLKGLGITVPSASDDTTKLNMCLSNLRSYYYDNLNEQLKKKKYSNILRFPNGTYIIYNDSKIQLYDGYNFRALDAKASYSQTVSYIYITVNRYNSQNTGHLVSFNELSNLLKDLTNLYFLSCSDETFDKSTFYWRVEGGYDPTYKAANAAAGAIVGGALFGGAGVIGGALSGSPEGEKRIVLSDGNGSSWTLASTTSSQEVFDSTLDMLNSVLPEYRAKTAYKKTKK